MTRYEPRHAKSANHTGPIIVTTTAALVAAVPGVAVAQAAPPTAPKPVTTTHTQSQPAVDLTRDIANQKLQVAKAQHHLEVVEVRRVRHQAYRPVHRAVESHPKPVKAPTVHLYGNLTQSQLAALWVRAGGNP